MRVTIDAAGRLVVPKPLRERLGLVPGVELEMEAVDGHLEVSVPSRVRLEEGPEGIRFVADPTDTLDADEVRGVIERGRR
jgi:AbrB family looped-hinge helix DNA binding protein